MQRTGSDHFLNAVGHVALAGLVCAPLLFIPWPALGAAGTAFVVFTFREWEQYSENHNLRLTDRLLDIAEGVLGAALLGGIVQACG